jgi:hypothetical protein
VVARDRRPRSIWPSCSMSGVAASSDGRRSVGLLVRQRDDNSRKKAQIVHADSSADRALSENRAEEFACSHGAHQLRSAPIHRCDRDSGRDRSSEIP